MKIEKVLCLALIALNVLLVPAYARAEDLNAILKRVNDYIAQENFPKALEELTWAEKEVQKMNTQKLGKVLPGEVQGFVGDPVKSQSAMGFTSIERNYKKGNQTIALSIAGTSSGPGGAGAGLAGLARMGMMMGAQEGTDTFRLDGKVATIKTEGSYPEITVALDSGSILSIKGTNAVDQATLKTFAEAFKISDIDNYLRGGK